MKDTPWLNGKHVVFGQVIKGMEVVKEVEAVETDGQDKPKVTVVIENCGEIKEETKEEEPKKEEPKAEEQPKTEEPQKTEEPKKEEPKGEEPKAEEPKKE